MKVDLERCPEGEKEKARAGGIPGGENLEQDTKVRTIKNII